MADVASPRTSPAPRPGRSTHSILLLLSSFLLLALLGTPGLRAQDPRDTAEEAIRESGIFGTDEEFTASYDFSDAETSEDFESLALLLLGNVVLEGRGFSLHADAIGFFIDGFDDEGRPKNPRVFAEGNILLTRGDQSFRAESLLFDAEAQRAVLTKARLRIDQEFIERLRQYPIRDEARARIVLEAFAPGPVPVRSPGRATPIVFAAELLTVEDFERIRGEGIEFTTCEFGHPHWKLTAEKGTAAMRQEVRPEPGEAPPGGWQFDLDNVWLEAGPVPVPLLPGLSWDSRWGRYLPLRSVSYSSSGKYGNRVDTVWDGNLLLPEALSNEMDVGIRLDYLEERGTGYGADVEWGRDPLRWSPDPDGRVELYGYGEYWAIEDRGVDSNGFVPDDDDRYRSRWHQRLRLQTGTFVDFEYAVESDENFLEEYYQGEARGEKTPENIIFVRQPVTGAAQITLLAQRQLNDYRTVTEKRPLLAGYWIEEQEPVTGISFDGSGQIGKLELVPDDRLPDPDVENQRADVRLLSARPVQFASGLRFRPFFQGRYTYWDEALDGDDEERFAFAGGGTVSTRVWRNFGTEIEALDIHGLRHVVDLDFTYENQFDVSVDPSELLIIDEIDQITEREVVRIGLFQRLFTRRKSHGRQAELGYAVRSLVDSRFEIEYYPDYERDNAGETWGPLEGEVLLTPVDRLGMFVDGEYDFDDGDLDEINTGLRWYEPGLLLLEISNRVRKGEQDTIVLGGRWQGSDKYQFGAFAELDERRDKAVNQRYSVVRHFHRWSAAFSVEIDEGEDNTTFRFDFGPRDLLDWSAAALD